MAREAEGFALADWIGNVWGQEPKRKAKKLEIRIEN